MNNLDSDLEDGEILDSPPSSPQFDNKRKKLPRRYIVQDSKTPIHKHKKGCKHAIRYYVKKLSKLKKSPTKNRDSPKFCNKPSCTDEKSCNVLGRLNTSNNFKHTSPKNGFPSNNSLIAEIKNSLAPPLKPLNEDFNKLKSQHTSSIEENLKPPEEEFPITKISSVKEVKNDVDDSIPNNMNTNLEQVENAGSSLDLSYNPDDKSAITKLNSSTVISNCSISNNSLKVKDEECEDLEELRRIALATCAKRKVVIEPEKITQNTGRPWEKNNLSVQVQSFHRVINNHSFDNYEVIDMDIDDDDMQDSLETNETVANDIHVECAENLFIIDKTPSHDFLQNKKKSVLELQTADNSDDEDLQDLNTLRAQLINSMHQKKLLKDNSKKLDTVTKLDTTTYEKQMHIPNKKKFSVNYQRQNLQYKRLKSAKHILRKRSVNKLVNTRFQGTSRAPLPFQTNKPIERLIITVNGDSSSDDSGEEETGPASENPLASISALISDCRQKSESIKKTEQIIPKAVECLSKAQQEEYSSLKRILAKKTKITSQGAVPPKNGSTHSPLNDLKILEKKFIALCNDLQIKKESMVTLTEKVNQKQNQYMKTKLTLNLLKEQFIAAERIRKAELLHWSRSCGNLKLMTQSVSDLEKKMNEVQILCSKYTGLVTLDNYNDF